MRRAVFLDRDGTLNRCVPGSTTTHPPASAADVVLVEGAEEACARLRAAGYLLLVVTNQPDVRRGTQTLAAAEAITERMVRLLHLDGAAACYHDGADHCACRKPEPGLLLHLAGRLGVDLRQSWMVGDRVTDVAAGRAAGCRTVLLSDAGQQALAVCDHQVPSISAAADLILASRAPREARMPTDLNSLAVKIYADGADLAGMKAMYDDPLIKGFTTNPTLMRKAGVRDYEQFARTVLEIVPDRPVSFEVLSDDLGTMVDQALTIGSWADNVYVKIPITNGGGRSTASVVRQLHSAGIKVNVTAILTLQQVREAAKCLTGETPSVVSVSAGRIADTGRDPVPMMTEAARVVHELPAAELLWASPRELLNIFHAEQAGCDIITATSDVLAKRGLVGKNLADYSLETVRMFCADSAGLDVSVPGLPAELVRASR